MGYLTPSTRYEGNAMYDHDIQDCIHWVCNVLTFVFLVVWAHPQNGDSMPLFSLDSYLSDSSIVWYDFIAKRFYSFHQFLSFFPDRFRLFTSGGIEMVCLVKADKKSTFITEEEMQRVRSSPHHHP